MNIPNELVVFVSGKHFQRCVCRKGRSLSNRSTFKVESGNSMEGN